MDESYKKEDNNILSDEELRNLFKNNIYFSDLHIEFLKTWLKDIKYIETNGTRFPYIKTSLGKKIIASHYYSDEEINQLNKNGIKVFAVKQNITSPKNYQIILRKPYHEISEGYNRSFKRNLKKAIGNELQLRMEWNMDAMYANYMETMKRLKSIAFPKEYFETLKEMFHAKAFNIVEEENILASMMTIENEDNFYHAFGFSNQRGREVSANHFLYDSLFRYASEKGLNTHFGPGFDGEGYEDFKSSTGAIKLKILIFPKEKFDIYKTQRLLLKLPISSSHRFFSTRFFSKVIKNIIPYT